MKANHALALAVGLYLVFGGVGRAEITNIRELTGSRPQIGDLSTAQVEQLSALTGAVLAQKITYIWQAEPFDEAIADSLGGAGPVDGAKLSQLLAQIAPIYAEAADKNLVYLLQIRGLLTPAQLSAIAARFQPTRPGHGNEDPTSGAGSYAVFHDDLGSTRGQHLSDAQMAQLATLEAAAKADLAPIWQESDADYVQLDSLLNSAGPVTFEQLEPLQQRLSALRMEHDAVGLDFAIKVLALLTPAQRAQAATLRAQVAALHAQEVALRNASASGN
jgi:Spy/CpxP family protein refolding chaperone